MKLKFSTSFILLFSFLLTAHAQVKNKTNRTKTVRVNTSQTSVKPTLSLNNNQDSLSYALGIDIANSLLNSGFVVNIPVLQEGLKQKLMGQVVMIDEDKISDIVSSALIAIKSKPGREFLEENKKRNSVKTASDGLQYEIIREGTGEKPSLTDDVTVHYKGTLIDGSVFDSSYDRGEPITFNLDRVIKGWKLGIPLMSVGSKYKFYIPYDLAYGERSNGSIPAFSTLIFEVELLEVKKK